MSLLDLPPPLLSPWEDFASKNDSGGVASQRFVGPAAHSGNASAAANSTLGVEEEPVPPSPPPPTFEMFWEPVPNSLYLTVLFTAAVFSLVSKNYPSRSKSRIYRMPILAVKKILLTIE